MEKAKQLQQQKSAKNPGTKYSTENRKKKKTECNAIA